MIFEAKDQLLSAAGAGILLGDRHMGVCVCVCLFFSVLTLIRNQGAGKMKATKLSSITVYSVMLIQVHSFIKILFSPFRRAAKPRES